MIVEPKVRVMLHEQISIIQRDMMKRAMFVFSKYEDAIDSEKHEIFNTLMKLYDKYTHALQYKIIFPLDDPSDQRPLNSATYINLIKRLNKGYAHFVYDTTSSRLNQIMEEEKNNEELNTETEDSQSSSTEPSFPEENQGDGE